MEGTSWLWCCLSSGDGKARRLGCIDGTWEEDGTAVVKVQSGQRRTAMGQGGWSERRTMSATAVAAVARGRRWSRGKEVYKEKGETGEVREREGVVKPVTLVIVLH